MLCPRWDSNRAPPLKYATPRKLAIRRRPTGTAESGAQGVHIVHTLFFALVRRRVTRRNRRPEPQSWSAARGFLPHDRKETPAALARKCGPQVAIAVSAVSFFASLPLRPWLGYAPAMARRSFLQWPVVRQLTTGDLLGRGPAVTSPQTRAITPRTATADRVVQSVCPYCAVGCGQRVYVKDEKVVQIEGDPDSPISRGRLCPKGSASEQLVNSPGRQTGVLYRAPRATEWQHLDLATPSTWSPTGSSKRAAERLAGQDDEGPAAAPHHGHRLIGRRDPGQRRELPDQEALHGRGRGTDREPSPYLTLRHGSQSGSLVRTRRRNPITARHGQRRLHHHSGFQHGRVPPCGIPVGGGGQGPWSEGHPRRSPVHPHSAVADKHIPIRAGSDVVLLGCADQLRASRTTCGSRST